MTKLNLSAVVVYTTTNRKTTTLVVIKAGDTEYATRHLSGRFSQQQALKEFRRFPEKFQPLSGASLDFLKAIAKVA